LKDSDYEGQDSEKLLRIKEGQILINAQQQLRFMAPTCNWEILKKKAAKTVTSKENTLSSQWNPPATFIKMRLMERGVGAG